MFYNEVDEINLINYNDEVEKIFIKDDLKNISIFNLNDYLKKQYNFNDDEIEIVDIFNDNIDDVIDEDINKLSLLSYSKISLKDIFLFLKLLGIKKIIFKSYDDKIEDKIIDIKDVIKNIIYYILKVDEIYFKRHIININNSIYDNINNDFIVYFYDEDLIKDLLNNNDIFNVIDNIDDIVNFKNLMIEDDVYYYYDNQHDLLHNIKIDDIEDVIDDDFYYDTLNEIDEINDDNVDILYDFFDDLLYEIKIIEDEIDDNDDVLLFY